MTAYRDRQLQRMYDTALKAAADCSSELYLNRLPRTGGAMHRCAFWAGFDGGPRPAWVRIGTLAGACWRAGKAFSARVERAGALRGAG